MLKEPPSALEVGTKALDDVKSNMGIVKSIILPVIPITLIVTLINAYAQGYFINPETPLQPSPGYYGVSLVLMLINVWVAVHYVLRWHLFTLKGSAQHEGAWFSPDKLYKDFFYNTFLLNVIVIACVGAPFLLGAISPILSLLALIPCMLAGIYISLRLSFLLPATALKHTPDFKQIWEFSEGMAWSLMWAPIRVLWPYIVGFIVYAVIAQSVLFGSGALGSLMVSFIFFTLPALIGGMLFALVCVGVLSRYYIWGLDNRTDKYGDYK